MRQFEYIILASVIVWLVVPTSSALAGTWYCCGKCIDKNGCTSLVLEYTDDNGHTCYVNQSVAGTGNNGNPCPEGDKDM